MNWSEIPEKERQIVNALLHQLKDHDEETYFHCLRVSQNCQFLAEAAGSSPKEVLQARLAGLLHDIGKAKIPVDILNKPSRLDNDEYEKMQDHASASAEMMEPLGSNTFFRIIQLCVLHHHERMDGKGYPFGLSADEIPRISRMILIADTLDAMTASRPYRKGLPIEVAYRELKRCSGTQFDAELVDIFISAHKNAIHKKSDKKVAQLFDRQKKAA